MLLLLLHLLHLLLLLLLRMLLGAWHWLLQPKAGVLLLRRRGLRLLPLLLERLLRVVSRGLWLCVP